MWSALRKWSWRTTCTRRRNARMSAASRWTTRASVEFPEPGSPKMPSLLPWATAIDTADPSRSSPVAAQPAHRPVANGGGNIVDTQPASTFRASPVSKNCSSIRSQQLLISVRPSIVCPAHGMSTVVEFGSVSAASADHWDGVTGSRPPETRRTCALDRTGSRIVHRADALCAGDGEIQAVREQRGILAADGLEKGLEVTRGSRVHEPRHLTCGPCAIEQRPQLLHEHRRGQWRAARGATGGFSGVSSHRTAARRSPAGSGNAARHAGSSRQSANRRVTAASAATAWCRGGIADAGTMPESAAARTRVGCAARYRSVSVVP